MSLKNETIPDHDIVLATPEVFINEHGICGSFFEPNENNSNFICDYTIDVECDDINDLFENLYVDLNIKGSDIEPDSDILIMDVDKLKDCLANNVYTLRYTRDSANIIIDKHSNDKHDVFMFPDANHTKKIIKRYSIFDRLFRVFLDICHGSADKRFGQDTLNYESISKTISYMLYDKQHAESSPEKYKGYDNIYHKIVANGILNTTYLKRADLFEALKTQYKNTHSLNDIDHELVKIDMSNTVFIYYFKYKPVLTNKTSNWVNEDDFDNECNNKSTIICIRILQNK